MQVQAARASRVGTMAAVGSARMPLNVLDAASTAVLVGGVLRVLDLPVAGDATTVAE